MKQAADEPSRNRLVKSWLALTASLAKLRPIKAIAKTVSPLGQWLRRYGLDVALVSLCLILLGQVSLLVFNQLHVNQPVLGTEFENFAVHGLSGEALQSKIQAALDASDQRAVVIKVGKFKTHVTARQLGATHDSRKVQQSILKLGRQGSLWRRLVDQDAAVIGQRNLKEGFRTINKQLASVYLAKVNSQVQVAPLDASFVYQNQQLAVQPGQPGLAINVDQAINELLSIDSNQTSAEFSLPVTHPAPAVSAQELQPLLSQAQQVVTKPLTIIGGDKQIQLDTAQLTTLLQGEKKPNPGNPAKQTVVLSYNDSKLSAAIDTLAAQVVVQAKPKVVVGQKVVSAGTAGLHLDGTHAKIEVITELEKRKLEPPKPTAAATTPPKTTPSTQPAPSPSASTNQTPPAKPPTTPASPPPATSTATPTPAPSASQVTPVTPGSGDSVIVPVEKIDPPVINQVATANPLGRYPATLNGKNMIYLTIDDGPGGYTEQLLDILKRYNVHAIFFLIGKNALAYPQTVKRIKAEGHTIGNHSYTHSDLAAMSEASVNDELVKTQTALRSLTGVTPDLFRPPYGSLGPSVYGPVARNGLNIMMWSIDPRDWSQPGTSVIVQRVVNGAAPGGNILLHSNHQQTVDALPSIIEALKAKGYSLP